MPSLQGTSKRPFPGLVIFVPAVAYHFCLNLPEAFSQPGNSCLEGPCSRNILDILIEAFAFAFKRAFFFGAFYVSLNLFDVTSGATFAYPQFNVH